MEQTNLQPSKNLTFTKTTPIDLIRSAIQSQKLSEASDKDLSKRFSLIFWMIGLRNHHVPTDEQMILLFKYIRKNYPNRSINELTLAFDKAINNQLDVEDYKPYDQFTLEYFVRIFNAYRKWSAMILKEFEKPIEQKTLPMPETTVKEMQEDINEYLSRKDLNINFTPPYLFDYAERLGLIKLSKEEKINIYEKAARFRKETLYVQAQSLRKEDMIEYNQFCQMYEGGAKNIKGNEVNLLKNLAKKIAFIDYATSNKL
jgi:hypothetical protein